MRRALLALAVFLSAACCLAADKKISELPSGSPGQAADMIPIARGGLNYRLAGSDFLFNTADLVISGAPPTLSLTNTATGGGTTTFTQVPSGTTVTGFTGSPTIDATTLRITAPECSWSNLGCFAFLIDDKYTLTGTSYAYPMLSGVNTFLMMDGTLATGKSAYIYGDHSLVTWNATATDANSAYVIGKLGEFYAFTNSTNLANGVGVSGYGAIYNGTTGTTAAGVRAEIYIQDTANFDEAAALRVVGTSAAGDGTDATKIFKYKATEYGRSLIDQPRDTDYALELTNGMGQLITGKTGQLQLAKAAGGSKPACAVGIRGSIWYEAGATDVADTLEVCRKDASNAYAWVSLY